ncbi:hypothetical protein DEM26_18775 [Thioclava sp. NG1]|uniref:acetyl-CoA carboxylase biotin carboxyl carrier protein n=1 Tax=Thioclava sp. NG1 TaxID=2182426 RepID=UPI000D6091A2|nr:acetyl-CoA carboxylase biotin carboxyl carrier protein subunit [Thioclava sp. NG1]PWE48385.1 hypothetical protein DEM26_18775 [Thioclava sp. NG1]
MPISIDSLISSMEWASHNKIAEYSFQLDGRRVTIVRSEAGSSAPHASSSDEPAPAASDAEENGSHIICAPLSGVCYLAKEGGADPFVTVGDTVSKGQTLCLVEAMKLMTSVNADRDGAVVEICVEEGASVEAGAPLIKVRA